MRVRIRLLTAGAVLVGAAFLGCKSAGKSADELFAAAQQLQQEEKYEEAVKIYRQVAARHSKTRQGANSQFMVGYIYANHLKDYDKARTELERFLRDYEGIADSGLIAGAKFELQFLGKSLDEIPLLGSLGATDTLSRAPDTTAVAP